MRWIRKQMIILFVRVKWYFLGDYYSRLMVQAGYLYKQSTLFNDRWQQMGLDYAVKSFEGDAMHFFEKAKKEHIWIRSRILLDSILGRPPQSYVMREDSIF